MQDGGQDAFQKPDHKQHATNMQSHRCDQACVRSDVSLYDQACVRSGVIRCRLKLTVRVDAVECRWRDDGHLTLSQRTLGGQLVLTG